MILTYHLSVDNTLYRGIEVYVYGVSQERLILHLGCFQGMMEIMESLECLRKHRRSLIDAPFVINIRLPNVGAEDTSIRTKVLMIMV